MTGFLFVLAMLALFASSVFGIWLLVLSFRAGILWGLAVLFIPFAILIFAIMYWQDCKKPFLGYLGTSVAGFMFLFMAFGTAVTDAATTPGQIGSPSASTEIDWERELPQSEPADRPVDMAAPAPMPRPMPVIRVAEEPRRPRRTGKIQFSRAEEYLGETVRVTGRDGRRMVGELIGARGDRLVLEKRLTAGVASFEVPRHDVASVEVIDR